MTRIEGATSQSGRRAWDKTAETLVDRLGVARDSPGRREVPALSRDIPAGSSCRPSPLFSFLPSSRSVGQEPASHGNFAAIPESHPLHRLFRGLTEYTFMNELGIGDPSLVGYVAELLASFVPSQGVWQLCDAQGERLFEVTAMVAEAEAAADAARRRECHRHVGDFTLFWTGVYPEALGKLQGGSADALHQLSTPGQAVVSSGERLERGQRPRDNLPALE